jgi:hypothetical protein
VNENHLRMLAWRRLDAIGFTGIGVEHGEFDFRFRARKPA